MAVSVLQSNCIEDSRCRRRRDLGAICLCGGSCRGGFHDASIYYRGFLLGIAVAALTCGRQHKISICCFDPTLGKSQDCV